MSGSTRRSRSRRQRRRSSLVQPGLRWAIRANRKIFYLSSMFPFLREGVLFWGSHRSVALVVELSTCDLTHNVRGCFAGLVVEMLPCSSTGRSLESVRLSPHCSQDDRSVGGCTESCDLAHKGLAHRGCTLLGSDARRENPRLPSTG